MICAISLADSECTLVGEYPCLNKIAGFTKVESVTKSPENTVSEGHFAGCERFICGPPAVHVPAPVGYFSVCQHRAFSPVNINFLYQNGVGFCGHGDIDAAIALMTGMADLHFNGHIAAGQGGMWGEQQTGGQRHKKPFHYFSPDEGIPAIHRIDF